MDHPSVEFTLRRTVRCDSVLRRPEIRNPFLSTTSFHRLPWYEKLKVTLMLPIGLIRFTGLVLSILLACFFGKIATFNDKKKEIPEPYSGFRRFMLKPIRMCARLALFFCGFHWIKVKGKVAPPSEAPVIVIAPHTSFIDGLVSTYCGTFSAVSRKENEDIPILGNAIKAFQPILVARGEKGSKSYTIKEIQRRAKSNGLWPATLLFPEGTCTNGQCLINFKPGAFYSGLPVQPVTIKYKNKLDVTSWTWTGPQIFEQLVLLFCQFCNHLEVEFLPVYKPSCEESQDAKFYARNVRDVMARSLGIPTTDHAYEDCHLMLLARNNSLPMEAGLIEYEKLHRKLGMNLDNMKELMMKFAEMDTDVKGQVTVEEFARYLKLPMSPEIEALFRLYDRDDSGYIDFREYVIGLSLVSEPLNSEETMKLAFAVFDVDKAGVVTEQGLKKILQSALPRVTDLNARCIFKIIDKDNKGMVSYDDFREFSLTRPEYAVLFTHFHKLREETSDGSRSVDDAVQDHEMVLPNATGPVSS